MNVEYGRYIAHMGDAGHYEIAAAQQHRGEIGADNTTNKAEVPLTTGIDPSAHT